MACVGVTTRTAHGASLTAGGAGYDADGPAVARVGRRAVDEQVGVQREIPAPRGVKGSGGAKPTVKKAGGRQSTPTRTE